MKILCGKLITPDETLQRVVIEIEDGRIAHVTPYNGEVVDFDASDKLATPGFIDMHIHGGVGRDVMDASPDSIRAISAHLAVHGVTSWLPTPLTGPWHSIKSAVGAVSVVKSEGSNGAEPLGVHLEGPYINPARKGAQPSEYAREPLVGELDWELGALVSIVRCVSLACELPGALDLIADLHARGITVSLAHTDATFEQARAAFDAGATCLTHTFNGMRGFHHREPGVLGASLIDDRVTAELIWDNFHVHPAAAQIAFRLKGPEKVALVSDAISAAGLNDGNYQLGGQPVTVKNGQARLPDGTIAGSSISLDQAVRNAAEHIPLEDAIKAATIVPAASIGVSNRKGRIAPGFDADIVLLNPDLAVHAVFLKGCPYRR